MNFLADVSVDRQIVDALREDDHAVLCVTEMDPGIPDDEVLDKAEKGSAIIGSNDQLPNILIADFGDYAAYFWKFG